MGVLDDCKMQLAIFIILLFVGYLFVKDGNRLSRKAGDGYCNRCFDWLFILGELAVLLDGTTACMVNHLDTVPAWLNLVAHLAYMLAYQAFIFTHFIYWLRETDSLPKKWWSALCLYLPVAASAAVTVVFIPQLEYLEGVYTNYSMGASAIACFAAVGIYSLLTLAVFLIKRRYIQRNKRTAFIAALSASTAILIIQMLLPETLVASIAVALVIISIYLCTENPTVKFVEYYHDEMVMGFATLVENKDDSTGGHIRRSSAYAVLIAEELRKNPKYKKLITKDYIMTLNKAAPMHDIGKIGVSDSILQKPGKLTDEEYAEMKKHPEIGGRIIRETFGHLDDEEFESMALEVSLGHHEKWTGKGYPSHLQGDEIPLCARIMAVADVFDAVSANRCYRAAMPLDKCYEIIRSGRGDDFDPDVVDAFFANRRRVEEIYHG